MAALWGLTVLLLCAANIDLAQFKSTPPPANTPNHTPSLHSDSQTNPTQTPTSPPVTTEKPTTQDVTTALPPAQTQCFYTVTAIPFGLQIDMRMNSTAGNYSIYLTEEGRPETRQTFDIQFSNQNSSHEIKHLKPCTRYRHEVAFINNDGNETFCKPTEDKNETTTDPMIPTVATEEMCEGDIKDGGSIPGFISFQSEWDISSSLSTPKKFLQYINESYHLTLDSKDICSDFTAIFTSGNCVNSSINITFVFLNASEINQTVPTGLPATISTTSSSKCKNVSVDYMCSENGNISDSKKLSELEPFTDYTCTGLIKVNNVSSDKRTPPIPVRIDCRLTPQEITSMRNTTNTSIELTWTTTSDNCQDALPRLQNLSLSYDCSCGTNQSKSILIPRPDGGKCSFTGLTPYTNYTCDIVPTYKQDKKDDRLERVYQRTDVGTPANITHVNWTLPENNVIKLSCEHHGDLFGPEKIYRARLVNVDDKLRESERCEFEFRDLSYSTSYTVELTVFNGKLSSEPKIINISTKYNDKALIGFLCFLIVITFVVVFVALYKIYMKKHRESRSSVNDEMMLESAIYMNTRPPGWRHKAAR